MIAFIFIVFYLIACFVMASIGSSKKIGFWPTFFISLFFSPITGLIVALVSSPQKVGSGNIKYIIQADKSIKNNDIPSAIKYLNQSLHYNANPISHYKLAVCFSLMKDKEKALRNLHKSVELGYSNFEKIENNPKLEWLRAQPEFSVFRNNSYQVQESQKKNNISQLKDLAELRRNNDISEEEYRTQKDKLLS
ncbi:TPR end-of-group domain-containing protein [Salinimicrobium sp. GXAS 041]|uniref:TPR end-of-group domain-containing protein n=1 Tax=Salinimicrobium sp. GXAS 041 TaxID=3400806 RepID=UPI003C70CEFF